MMITSAHITGPNTLVWSETEYVSSASHVLLEGMMSGISAGTELMWFNGTATALTSGRRDYPYAPGYAFIGQVQDIGAHIENNPDDFPRLAALKPGDRVFAFKPHASHAQISEADLWIKIPDTIPIEDALGLALACTCLHALHRSHIHVGDHAAVMGLGMLGFMMISCLRAAGAGHILAVSQDEAKRKQACQMCADRAVAPDTQIPDEASDNRPDIIFECSGKNAYVDMAMHWSAPQGKIIAAGFYTEPITVDGETLFSKELTLYGVRASGANAMRDEFMRWPRAENLKLAMSYLERGYLRTHTLISHRILPQDLSETYALIQERKEPYTLIAIEW